MSFWGKTFIFDEVPSEYYELFLCNIGGSGVGSNMGQTQVEPYTAKVYRNPKVYLYGTEQSPVLTFQMTFGCEKVLDTLRQQAIQKWLFGHQQYKKLRISQCDMQDVYFNCILTDPKIVTIGNLPYAVECTVICDSPWAWEYDKSFILKDINGYVNFNFENTSDDNYYMFPIIEVELEINQSVFQLTNITDNNQKMQFTGLLGGEKITIDCEKGLITSQSGLKRLDNFKGTLFRLLPGLNNISFNGQAKSLVIKYQNARKVSG